MFKCIRMCVLAITLLVASMLPGPDAAASAPATANTLDRNSEPVIVKGSQLPNFQGAALNQLYVYAFRSKQWVQIPFQIDEVTPEGEYANFHNGVLNANDEVVFMAKDVGDRVVTGPSQVSAQAASITRYEIEVNDPVNAGKKGWAYIVRSPFLEKTFTQDYVRFNASASRIESPNHYFLGFATPRPWLNFLSFGAGFPDILDRAPKVRLCFGAGPCFTEEFFPNMEDNLIKDGPVRLIVRGGRVVAYERLVSWSIPIADTLGATRIRFSTNFNANAVGARLYNRVAPGGVTVNGVPDNLPETPFSPWWQLSTDRGSAVQVADTSSMGGTQKNYYIDDASGGNEHYGEIGVEVENPNRSFTYDFSIYFLPPNQPNVGETFTSYFSQPLMVTVRWQQTDLPRRTFVPMVIR